MKIKVYYIDCGDAIRVWDKEREEYGQFEIVTREYFALMQKCPFLRLIEERP